MHLNCGHHNFNLSITIYFTMKKHVGILFFFMLTIVFSGIAQTIHHWETAVFNNDMWKYFSGKSEPNDLWRQLNFDDSLWKSGQGGFGYGDDDDNTNIEQDAAPAYQYPPSVYLRIKINIPDTSKISFGYLQMDVDDAFVAYINDIEIARLGIGVKGDNPAFNQLGANHEATMYAGGSPESFLISKATLRTCLKPGQNVLAIQVHNSSYTSSDMSSNAYLSFAIRDASVIFRPTPSWFVEPDLSGITPDFTSSNLPVVVINTNGASIIDEPKIPADMKIIFHDDKSPNYLSDPGNVYDGKIGIEIRGASSAGFPQKPYGLETRDMTVANLLAEAQIRHEKKWKTLGKNVGAPEIDYQPTTFAGDITKFKNWITTRLAWLDANMVGQSTAISDMSAEVSLRVYPNPVQHELTIEAGDKMKRIVLLNSIGQHVVDIQPNTEIISVETAPLPRGMYIVNITLANGKQLTSKIIKE